MCIEEVQRIKAVRLTVHRQDITEHAQTFMKNIGVKYKLAVPQSVAGCWQFYMCEYWPDLLPDFISIDNNVSSYSSVGFGLSEKDALDITTWMRENGFLQSIKNI